MVQNSIFYNNGHGIEFGIYCVKLKHLCLLFLYVNDSHGLKRGAFFEGQIFVKANELSRNFVRSAIIRQCLFILFLIPTQNHTYTNRFIDRCDSNLKVLSTLLNNRPMNLRSCS